MFLHFKPDRDSELDDCRERAAITTVSRVDIVSRGRAAAHQTQAAARKAAAIHSQV